MRKKKEHKRNLGKAFENLIEAANQQYYIRRLAVIEKNEIQKKQVGGKLIYAKKGPPDFTGTIRGGTAVAFDAKSIKGKSIGLRRFLDREHQLKFLERYEELGGIAFYLVHFQDPNRVFILPIGQLLAAIERADNGGRKSIALDEFKIEVKPTFRSALDYLQPFLNEEQPGSRKQNETG